MSGAGTVIWHDLECGSYREDLPCWLELAAEIGGPILDVGAGTGRVSLPLARAAYAVTALDCDAELLGALAERAGSEGLPVETVRADARAFALGRRFALAIVPMQTVQLLGGAAGRAQFLAAVSAHLGPGSRLAVSISERLEPFAPVAGGLLPLPDIVERGGTVYSSQPTAVRPAGATYVLERRREVVDPDGGHEVTEDAVALDVLDADELEREAAGVGLRAVGRTTIPGTDEYVASTVVSLDA